MDEAAGVPAIGHRTGDAEAVLPLYVAPDRSEFDWLYRSELASIVAMVYALCGNRWAAEDLAHDAFAIAYRDWDRVRRYEKPGAFVRKVALNLARSRGRRIAAEARALARQAAGRPPSVQPIDPRDATFWRAVRELPARQREIVVLRYVEDLPDADIAEMLGCSEQTVRVHAHRAKQSLSERLAGELS